MVWLRRCTHYLFIVVVAVNSTLLTINSGDYIFYTDWAWTSFVVFSIANTLMTVVEAIGYLFCVKVAEEGTTKKSNGQIAAALAGTTAIMLYVALYIS